MKKEIKDLIAKLAEKTRNGQALWKSSSSSFNQLVLELNKATIVVDKFEIEADSICMFTFKVLNENGTPVVDESLLEGLDDYEDVSSLHVLARSAALKEDETLKSIYDQIESGATLGQTREIPF